MPGENCAIVGCSTSRRNKGISFFKVPKPNNDVNKKWGDDLINAITKDREVDPDLKARIETRKLFICERHFSDDQFYVYDTRKKLKEGEIPKLNLPKKSCAATSTTSRSTSSIQKRDELSMLLELSPPTTFPDVYKDFKDFQSRVVKLSLGSSWEVNIKDSHCTIICYSPEHCVPKFEIFVDQSLSYTVRIFGWTLLEDHEIYSSYNKTFKNVTLSNFIFHLEKFVLCDGITTPDPSKEISFQKHIIPKVFDYLHYNELLVKPRTHQDQYYRANNCSLLISSSSIKRCSSCSSAQQSFAYQQNRKAAVLNKPAKLNAPIKFTSPERVKITLQETRLECKQLKAELASMKKAIEKHGEVVDETLSGDFKTLFSKSKNVPNFMKLFWDEQQKYIQSSCSSSIRYHPMIIKFCLNLAAKSNSAYNDLRYDAKTGNGFLILPSLRTLRDYRNYIHPTRGFNPAVVNDLKQKTVNFSGAERYITILFDEMKIQEDLVWDKYSGELIGFVDLGDIHTNYATLKNVEELASHILVFLVKSIVNPLSFSFASFATTGVTSYQIMGIFWKAVLYLEQINLHVIAATADGASPNRRFFRMNKLLQGPSDVEVVHRAKNIYAKEERYIYFFADTPHLIKTARNCLSNSGSGRATRYMWNSGFFILWSHITQLYDEQLECGLKLAPKLSSDHVNLTPYSVMRVNLAAQVLSDTVGNVLKQFMQPEAEGTANFCLMMDKFFDCLNVRNKKEHEQKKKPFLKPYESVNDERFEWLDSFLDYFRLWKESIEERPGDFTQNAKSRMFISWQTYEGLQVTVHSLKEVVKYLLQNGVRYVLSERFCQDDLENYFGRQRAIGRWKDTPNVYATGYNDNNIKSQFSVRPIAGNVRGAAGKFNHIDNTPLPKRKK